LLSKNYIVHGIKRRASSFNTQRIDHLYKERYERKSNLFLHYGDLSDSTNIIRIIQEVKPHEIYNLGAMSHVHVSFETPEYSANVDGLGTLRVLEAVRLLGLEKKTKIYQASTSELFGRARDIPQNELTPFYPRSPYAAAKLYAYWITINYREAYGMFACNGILFNHESPRRGETFVTRKVTRAAAAIAYNLQKKVYLGNLNARRDWGHAKDYVVAMHLILQQPEANDYIVASGHAHTVRDFVRFAFEEMGIFLEFTGEGCEEKGFIASIDAEVFRKKTGFKPIHLHLGQVLIEVKVDYFRPSEVDFLLGDASKIRKELNWVPQYTLKAMIKEMIEYDLELLRNKYLNQHSGQA
jgi:GDPmannose 4,6-dehydratase